MNDVIIKIDTSTAKTYCENNKIGVKHANLQNKLIFKMTEKIIGNAWLEYEIDGDKNYAEMEEIEDGYQIIIKSCLLISDYINVDLKITETENADGIPVFVSTKEKLEVYDSINASKEEPEYYPDWKTIADSKIAEISQLKRDLNIAESTRVENENTRQYNETTRNENENTRQSNETTRIENETTRQANETTRINNESSRVIAENKRISAESERVSNEVVRQNNEVIRNSNEETRISQENAREEYIDNLKQDVEDGKFNGNGIVSFVKTSTTGLVDTYTIVFTNGATTTLNVINGKGIISIDLTSKQDNIDTYTISYNDGTTSTFTVTNSTVTDQEFDKLTNEVDKYKTIYNVLPKVSGEGTDIELKDTGNAMLAFNSFNGYTSQKTTTGKNLFDKDNQVKVQVNSEGTLRYGIIVDAPNKKVSISAKNWNNSIAVKQLINGTYGDFLNINSNTTFDVVDKLIIYSTSDTDKLDSNIEELQVEINDVPTNYESFTGCAASPSPDYPQDIKVATGEQNVKIQNKNILNAEMVKKINSKNTITIYQNVQCIKLWGQSGTIGTGIKYKENTSYSFVFNYVGTTMGTKNDIGSLYFVYTDGTQNLLTYFTGTTAKGIRRYTSNPNKTLKTIRWSAWAPSQAIYLATNELQLVEGSEQYNLIQHQEQNYPLSLGNRELARINNYKDYIFKNEVGSPYYNADLDLNEWYLCKEIGKVVLDGTNNVFTTKSGQPGNTYTFNTSNFIEGPQLNIVPSVLSNKFVPKSWDDRSNYLDNAIMFIYSASTYLVFRFGTSSSLTTLELANAWLINNNVTLYGILATPTNTKITDTTLIQQLENINNNARSYSDTTIIICSSESEDNETIQASVTALKDISTLFEQVNNAIIEIGGGE